MARRVVEILDYFDDAHPEATVRDFVANYGWPQSSTSDLLASMVELGVLHRDPYARSYRLAARAALLGTASQPRIVRDGGLVTLVDRLSSQTGLAVGLFGMVDMQCQVVAWRDSSRGDGPDAFGVKGGTMMSLSACAAGWLLLSTVAEPRREGMVRRLHAEVDEAQRFPCRELLELVRGCGAQGHAFGPAGLGGEARMLAVLLPELGSGRPLAVGFVFEAEAPLQVEALLPCLYEAVDQCRRGGCAVAGTQGDALLTAA
jgi:DNA-binding IclR family transcriptional regulator